MAASSRDVLRISSFARLAVLAAACLVAMPADAANGRADPPAFVLKALTDGTTPLAGIAATKIDKRLEKSTARTTNDKPCSELAESGKRPAGKGNTDAKKCGVPGYGHTKHSPEDITDPNGNVTGRKVRNDLELHYDLPQQRGLSKWSDIKVNPARTPQASGVEKNRLPDVLGDVVGVQFGANEIPPEGKSGTLTGVTCASLGDDPRSAGEDCDLQKRFVKLVNDRAKSEPAPAGKQKKKDRAFWANEDGTCKEGEPTDGTLKCGAERRVHKIKERFEAKCEAGFKYENGHCKGSGSAAARAFAKELGIPEPSDTVDGSLAIMGFTFAPPKVGWHIEYSEQACIDLIFDDFCFTIFSAWVGYEIDIAAGLRLPVEFKLETVPEAEAITTKAIAGRLQKVKPVLEAADFSVADYLDFCNMQDNPRGSFADGWIIASCDRFSFPEYFSRLLVSEVSGTAVNAKTDAAGYAAGATTIRLSAGGQGSIKASDSIIFEGDSNKYTVEVGDAEVANGGEIRITAPGLKVGIPASATPIVIANGLLGGSASGAKTEHATHAKDATQIQLGAAGSGSILIGDSIVFGTDSNRYSVVEGDSNVSDGGTITIDPGLAAALTGDTPITVRNEMVLDGKELVAQSFIKAGAFVEILSIPVVNLGINAGADFATLCTLHRLYSNFGDLTGTLMDFAKYGQEFKRSLDLLQLLKDEGINCASFQTPFGAEKDDVSGVWVKPTFPFLNTTVSLPADCDGDDVTEVKFKLRGAEKKVKLCTGLEAKYGPLTLGLGLDIDFGAASGKITGTWQPMGDGREPGFSNTRCNSVSCPAGAVQDLEWLAPDNGNIVQPVLEVLYDNYEDAATGGRVRVDNLKYCLNEFQVTVSANLSFGGVLDFLPEIASFPVFSTTFGGDNCGIPIPQHNGTRGMDLDLAVANYALALDGGSGRPTLEPGVARTLPVTLRNLGTETGSFDNFSRILPDQADSTLAQGWVTEPTIDELKSMKIEDVAPSGGKAFDLKVTALQDPLTRPGNYTIQVFGDSVEARDLKMADTDPRGNARRAAKGELLVYVDEFRDPRIEVKPASASGKPGAAEARYTVEVRNWGNVRDAMKMEKALVDSNAASCTLRTLGSSAACPYRAYPTVVASAWTNIAGLTARLPVDTSLFLAPTGRDTTSFTLRVPPDWAGMKNTTYTVLVKATSETDTKTPKANKTGTFAYTVVATKQSMTRYIGMELEELAREIEKANAAGTSTGGALPIIRRDVQAAHARALTSILGGDLGRASTILATEVRGMDAFLHAIRGGGIPAALVDDWTARANAIIQDMTEAQASNVAS
jgi:hypothetical protein